MKKIILFLSAFFIATLLFASSLPGSEKVYISNYENVLGTSLELKIFAVSNTAAQAGEKAALAEIDRLDLILSGYRANSEFNRWMSGPSVPTYVSPALYEVLDLFEQWKLKSNGALDPAAAVVGNLWKSAGVNGQVPSNSAIASAVEMLRHQHYVLNPKNRTALRIDKAALVLNSFTKSYIMNKAVAIAMKTPGITGLVLNIGGDLVLKGNRSENIQISNPRADAENDVPITEIKLTNRAIATSGNYRRGENIQNHWYSHIVDPRTGLPSEEVINSTVIASNPTDAGALATIFSVLHPAESQELAKKIPGIDYLIITRDGRQIESTGWKNLVVPVAIKAVSQVKANTAVSWDPNFELLISLQLPEKEGERVHRPYVAVWIINSKNEPVRSIALWYNKTRYLDEMHAWYATYYQQFSDPSSTLGSTTSATRAAGNYSLKWNGKDDKGGYVSPGKYTICIEAARQHGSYQLIKREMTFDGKPATVLLEGNEEIKSASLVYRRKVENGR